MPRSTIGIVPIPLGIRKLAYEQQKAKQIKSNPLGQNEVETEKTKAAKRKKFEDGCKQRSQSH